MSQSAAQNKQRSRNFYCEIIIMQDHQNAIENRLLTINDICSYLQCSRSTFYRLAAEHWAFDNPIKVGQRGVRYKQSDLLAYVRDMQLQELDCSGEE